MDDHIAASEGCVLIGFRWPLTSSADVPIRGDGDIWQYLLETRLLSNPRAIPRQLEKCV
jgi:hypothetical protein